MKSRSSSLSPSALPGAYPAQSGLRARIALLVAGARAFLWGHLVVKLALAAAGLALLGAIGSSARARDVLSTAPVVAVDAGPAALSPALAVAQLAAATPSATAVTPAMALPSSSPATPATGRSRATPDDPVYLNQATQSDLQRLPGVGAKRALAILALRTRLGHFRQIEDLMKVKGIGRASLRKLRPLVRLDPPPAVVTDAGLADSPPT
jgi:competence protein ComEA